MSRRWWLIITERFTFADMDSRWKMQRVSLHNPSSKHHSTIYQYPLDESKSSCAMQALIPDMSFLAHGVQNSGAGFA